MSKKYFPLFILTPLIILLDQWSKFLIVQKLAIGNVYSVIPQYFEIVHVRNPGAAFSFLADWDHAGRNWFFYGIGLIALIALFWIYRATQPRERKIQIPLAMILGGALGNLIDRMRYGEVVDFLRFHYKNEVADFNFLGKHFHFWLSCPSFNVADAAISVGGILLAWYFVFGAKAKARPEEIKTL